MSKREVTGRGGLGCLLVAMTGLALLGGVGLVLAGLGAGSDALDTRFVEVVEAPKDTPVKAAGKLAIVEISGVLVDGSTGFGGPDGVTSSALAMLKQAERDESVRGVLLALDTPGGSVTDSDLIHMRVKALRAAGKKVVVQMGDLCASGGYYVAVAADQIRALPTTVTGSIGVIIGGLNVAELMQNVGVRDTSIMSGPNKALFSPTRPVEPAHQAILQGVVDELYQRFVQLVAEGRKLDPEKVRALADGRIYTATQALAAGLVDVIGYREEALDALEAMVGAGPLLVVRYVREPSLADLFRAQVAPPRQAESALVEHHFAAPRAMYLFAPFAGARE